MKCDVDTMAGSAAEGGRSARGKHAPIQSAGCHRHIYFASAYHRASKLGHASNNDKNYRPLVHDGDTQRIYAKISKLYQDIFREIDNRVSIFFFILSGNACSEKIIFIISLKKYFYDKNADDVIQRVNYCVKK